MLRCDKPLEVRLATASSETTENPASDIWLETTGKPPPPPGATWQAGIKATPGGWIAESVAKPVKIELQLRRPSVVRSVELGWKFGSPASFQIVLTPAEESAAPVLAMIREHSKPRNRTSAPTIMIV